MSRAAEDNAGLWTLSVVPAFDKEENEYVQIFGGAVVATNAKGTSVRTQFAYQVEVNNPFIGKVGVSQNLYQVAYAEAIDVLAPVYGTNKDQAIVNTNGMYEGKYILEIANPVQEELYGLSVEGSKLIIGKMPENKLDINVDLKITVLGLNGSTNSAEIDLTIKQQIAASKDLADQKAELVKAKNVKEYQKIRYNVVDLGLSLVELDNLLKNEDNINLTITREAERELPADEFGYVETETVTWVAYNGGVNFYDAKGNKITADYAGDPTNYVTFGFDFNPASFYATAVDASKYTTDAVDYEMFSPFEYKVELSVEDGSTKIYGAEGILTVSNPATAQGSIELASAFVEEGVLQITGIPANGRITYDFMTEALIEKGVAKVTALKDLGYDKDNSANIYDSEKNNWDNVAGWNWINGTSLNVFTRTEENLEEGYFAFLNLYEPRQIEIEYMLFKNPNNKLTKVIDIIVKSELYNEDATKAVEFDAAKLTAIFGGDPTTADVTEEKVEIKKAIKKAIVQAGTDKGKTYNLFATGKATTTGAVAATYDYRINTAAPGATEVFNSAYFTKETAEIGTQNLSFVLNSSNDLVEIEAADLKKFGMSAVEYAGRDEDSKKYYITLEDQTTEGNSPLKGLYSLYAIWRNYNQADGTDVGTVADADAVAVALYDKYVVGQKVAIKPTNTPSGGSADTTLDKARDSRVASVTIKFNDPAVAAIYFDGVTSTGVVFEDLVGTDYSDITIKPVATAPNSVTGGQVKVGMTLTIRDAWGMIMNVPFEVTVKTSAN